MASCPSRFPKEFRDDVVRVSRDREPDVTIEQVAKDFGVQAVTLHKCLQRGGRRRRQARCDAQ